MIEGYYSDSDMLTLLNDDPNLAVLLARNAAVELVETVDNEIDTFDDLEEYQQNIYIMARIIIYLTTSPEHDKMELH